MKRLRLFVVAAVVPFAAAGCSQPFHAGAAATVGPTRIATTQLRGIADRGLAAVPAGTTPLSAATVEQQALTQLIRLAILEKMAKNENITVTSAEVQSVISQAATQEGSLAQLDTSANASGIASVDLTLYAQESAYETAVLNAIQIPTAELMAEYEQNIASFREVHVAHILVTSQALAEQILTEARANPSSFGALAKEYSIDTESKNNGGDLGFALKSAYVAPFADAAFAAQAGTIIGPVHSQYGYHVIDVIAFRTESFAQVEPSLRTQALEQSAFATTYVATMKALGVHVSPRFGQWVATGGSDGFGDVEALSDSNDLSVPVSPTPTASASAAS